MKIPFNRVDITELEKDYVSSLLNSSTMNCVQELEENFASYVESEYTLATSHGTSALHLAMLALELKRGDKVICSVNAFADVPEVVRHFDAEPVFMDIEEDSFNMDLNKLENYLEEHKSKKLKAVIVSHIAGQCVDLERLYNIAKIYNVKIVEDASDALGAVYKGQKVGSKIGGESADIICFNFNPYMKKSVCNGGMLVTNDEDIYERAKLLRNHALTTPNEGLQYIYNVSDIGTDYTMSQLDAAFLLGKLDKRDSAIRRQKEIAKIYDAKLAKIEHISTPVAGDEHIYTNYIIKVDKNRDSFARALEEKGIQTAINYIPLHLMSYYKAKYELRINDFPTALRNYSQILSIPIFSSMSDKEVEYVCKTIADVAKNRV